MIYVESRKKSTKTLLSKHPGATIIDVTSKADEPFVRFSPFFPHGDIPVPLSPGYTATCVEGIWQGLKVFEDEDIDISKFKIVDMKGIKRTVRKFGKPLGHRNGVNGTILLNYLDARYEIYLKAYAYVLQSRLIPVLEHLKSIAEKSDLVLLDYETNEDIDNVRKPLSHAALVKKYLLKKYPELSTLTFTIIQPPKQKSPRTSSSTKNKKRKLPKKEKTPGQIDLFSNL
jgi:hypothetical protein